MSRRYRTTINKAETFQQLKRYEPRHVNLLFKSALSKKILGFCGFLFAAYLGFSLAESFREQKTTISVASTSQTLKTEDKSSLNMTTISLSENRNTTKFHQISSPSIARALPVLNVPKIESENFERWSVAYPELVKTARNLDVFRDPKSGLLQIGSFSTFNVHADQHQCETFREIFLEKLKGTERSFRVIADTKFIYIARICAQNGSLILNCRNGQLTIGARQSRPDDKCS